MFRAIAATLFFALACSAPASAADLFDRHTLALLKPFIESASPVGAIPLAQAASLKPLSATISNPCIVVQTNDGNTAKLLLAWGRHQGENGDSPVVMLERYVTYRGDRPGLTTAVGKEVVLFPGFGFNLDLGQVVPAGHGADIEIQPDGTLKPVGNAQIYLLTASLLPTTEGSKIIGTKEGITPADFEGTWLVSADGRWRGELELKLTEGGKAIGTFTSEDSQSEYDAGGQIGGVPHNLKVNIFLANAELQLDGYLWTTDKSQMAGTATLAGRKFGFVAKRPTD